MKAGVELGYDEASVAEGIGLMQQVGKERALAEIQATVDAVKSAGKVAVVGYCWGGYLAYAAGNQVKGLACAVGYYGGGIVDDYGEKRKVPTLLHFGENDAFIPLEAMSQFRAFRPDVSVFSYPGASHGFNCDQRDSYQAEAAQTGARSDPVLGLAICRRAASDRAEEFGRLCAGEGRQEKEEKGGGDDLGPPMD